METIELRGHKYCAIESPTPGKCGNCALKNGFGCLLSEARLNGASLEFCSAAQRKDGKDVHFVPAYSQKLVKGSN